MRHRRWVVVLAILIIAILPLGFLGLRVASRHPAVKRAVLSRIMPEVRGDLTIGELDFGLTSIDVSDVVVDLGGGSRIVVPSASINLSLLKLLTAGLTPERSLSTIIVSDPEIVVAYGHGGDGDREFAGTAPLRRRSFDVSSLESYIPDYLGVSGASVTFLDVRTGRRLSIDSIDLLLERGAEGLVGGGATGNCLGGEGNLQAHFTWDSDLGALSVLGTLRGATLDERLPVPPDVGAEILSGAMSGSFTASVSPDSIGALDLSFDVENGVVVLTASGEQLTAISARGYVSGGEVGVDRASGEWRGAEWSASGRVATDGGALADVRFEAVGLPLGPVSEVLELAEYEIGGRVDVSASVEGTLDDPIADVTVGAGKAEAGGVELQSLSASATISSTEVDVRGLNAAVLGGEVVAEGRLRRDASTDEWSFDVEADVVGLDIAQLAEAGLADTSASGTLSLTDMIIEGTLADPRLESIVRWEDIVAGPTRLGSGAGGFMLAGGNLSASLGSSERTYLANLTVDDVFGAQVVTAEVSLSGLVVDSLLPALASAGAARLTGTVAASGPSDSLTVGGEVSLLSKTATATVKVSGTAMQLLEGDRGRVDLAVESRDATLRGVSAPFTAGLTFTPSELSLNDLRVAGSFEGDISIGLDETRVLNAGLVVSEADLPDVLRALTGTTPEDADGLVFASVSIHGTIDDPVATAQVSVGAAEVAGVRGLDASAVMSYAGGVIELTEFVVREAGRQIVTASGHATPGGELEVAVGGKGIPGPMLGGSASTRFDATIGLGGTTGDPTLDGQLTSESGEFLGIPFDTYSARVTVAGGVARVDPLVVERKGGYRATAVGTVPFGVFRGEPGAPEGTLAVEVDGNPLAFLCEFTDVAGCGPGRGTLSAVLVGDGESVTVASASLEARAERVFPTGLFERIDDVAVSASVLDGAVVSGRISGAIDGGEVVVASERGISVDGRELPPLVVGGVDLGVVGVRTDEKGVTANVPGLMLPDEFGAIVLRGKEGEPSLLIAGPTRQPLLWGEIEFSDLSFTYPFVSSDDGPGIGDLMSDAEWSLRMVAGRNLWYWRPDANLNIERGGSLDFVGVPSQHTMCVSGNIVSTRGTVTYLHTEFDVREVSVEFPSFCEQPRFTINAQTRVADGTVIGLSMQLNDGAPELAASGVTLDESALVLTSDSPDDNTPEKIMAKLQYGVSYDLLEEEQQADLERRRAVELVGTQIGLRVARPLLAPIESRIRRNLNLDLVRIDVDFLEHFLMQMDLWTASEGTTTPYVPFTANTRVTLGKYISRDWMFSYEGVVESYEQDIGETVLGLRSELGIEYEVSRNTSLSLRVVYDPALAGWDRRVTIENRFEF